MSKDHSKAEAETEKTSGAPPVGAGIKSDPEDTPALNTDARIKVRATQAGYYGDASREVGEEFYIASPEHLSARWMERVKGKEAKQPPVVDKILEQK